MDPYIRAIPQTQSNSTPRLNEKPVPLGRATDTGA